MASQTRNAGLGQSIVMAGGSSHWSGPTNIYASDNVRSGTVLDIEEVSHWLRATAFGFTIPAGATIDGIVVEIERRANDYYTRDYSVKIVKAGSEQGVEHKSGAEYPSGDAYETYGGSTDKWGLTWTLAQINATNFGVSLACRYGGDDAVSVAVDHIRITVYYTEVALTNMKINIGDSFKDVDEIKINIGDSWKIVTKIQINIGDVWKTVFG